MASTANQELLETVTALKQLIVRWYLNEISDEQFRDERYRLLAPDTEEARRHHLAKREREAGAPGKIARNRIPAGDALTVNLLPEALSEEATLSRGK